MLDQKSTVQGQAQEALTSKDVFQLENALRRALVEIPEQCAKRVDTYALALEFQRHMGLPDPIGALDQAAVKVRELAWVPL